MKKNAIAKAVRTNPLFRMRVVKSKKCFKRQEKHRHAMS
jgi:stalled ribosome alternative rescue factor ArfA